MAAKKYWPKLEDNKMTIESNVKQKKGIVYLIGAGPGDENLITLKGVLCLNKATVVLYDYLVNKKILVHANPDAEMIYVGKSAGKHSLKQHEINDLILEKAKAGNRVARLKGGDPLVFGRGGEEMLILEANNIDFEVVPGVTAGVAAPAYAGIPVTHRSYASTLTFITGHEDPTKEDSHVDWKNLAQNKGTLVFYMGMRNLPLIVASLIKNGMTKDMPVGLVRWGTTQRQETVTGTLSNIVQIA